MEIKRVIFDTNIWIAYLITNSFKEIDSLILKGEIRLIFSKQLLEEFLEVIVRPKFKKYFTPDKLTPVLDFIKTNADFVEVVTSQDLCRDKKDNFLLDLAVDSDADFLVTGDKDLLELKGMLKTEIVEWNEFLEKLKI